MDAIKVKLIGLSRGGGGNLQPNKTATPTKQEQTVRPDPGYDGLRQVTVEAIPDQYADVSGVDAGAGDVRVGKVIVGPDGETITGTMPPQKPEEIGHATPTEQAQTVTPTAGSVFSAVEVEPIPSEYADVSGVDATAADVRTGKIIVDAQGDTVTGEMEPQKPEQSKSVVPTVSSQLVVPDTGYALSRVDVGAIPSEYADVSDVTATAGTVLTGSDFVDASGSLVHGACDFDADTSDADATAGQIEAGATAYVNGAKVTGTKPIRTTDVEISDLSPVPIPAGSYDGTASAKIDDAEAAKIVPANIKKDVEIFGRVGTYEGVDTLEQYFANTLTSVNDTHATSIPAWMFRKKSALVSATFQNLTATGQYDFADCSNLESFSAPNLTNIGSYSFGNDVKLSSINMPIVAQFAAGCFQDCGLISADFPLVTQSGGSVFNRCSKLTSVNLPLLTTAGVVFLGSCPLLESVDFPVLTSIQASFFEHCHALNAVILRKSDAVCTLSNINAFVDTPFASNGSGGTLYVPQSMISQYEQATNWSVILAYTNNQILPIEGSPYEVTT